MFMHRAKVCHPSSKLPTYNVTLYVQLDNCSSDFTSEDVDAQVHVLQNFNTPMTLQKAIANNQTKILDLNKPRPGRRSAQRGVGQAVAQCIQKMIFTTIEYLDNLTKHGIENETQKWINCTVFTTMHTINTMRSLYCTRAHFTIQHPTICYLLLATYYLPTICYCYLLSLRFFLPPPSLPFSFALTPSRSRSRSL